MFGYCVASAHLSYLIPWSCPLLCPQHWLNAKDGPAWSIPYPIIRSLILLWMLYSHFACIIKPYSLERFFFSKYCLRKNYLSKCDAPLLTRPLSSEIKLHSC
jgi:hypothetical protein